MEAGDKETRLRKDEKVLMNIIYDTHTSLASVMYHCFCILDVNVELKFNSSM
jgi:hypothetical protein